MSLPQDYPLQLIQMLYPSNYYLITFLFSRRMFHSIRVDSLMNLHLVLQEQLLIDHKIH